MATTLGILGGLLVGYVIGFWRGLTWAGKEFGRNRAQYDAAIDEEFRDRQ